MANGHGGARPNTGRKRKAFPAEMVNTAMDKIYELAKAGDVAALKIIIDRSIPALRAVSHGIDAKLVEAKIQEITIMAERIAALEAQLNKETSE